MPRIYHITHVRNLASILDAGGLLANSQLSGKNVTPLDISHGHIQERRAQTLVPLLPGGNLHDYVPFYFASRSPMLYTISRGNLESCPEGQAKILHLVAEAEDVQMHPIPFVFTDGHATMAYSEFYDALERLDEVIDWGVMQDAYWNDTAEHPDRKRKRQAEFLVHQFLPWELVRGIGVLDSQVEKEVRQILQTFGAKTPVKVYPAWYY
jgi:ssDNA thymidine ADP-ribosyltransferase, DarT